jgi:hypothetical protein
VYCYFAFFCFLVNVFPQGIILDIPEKCTAGNTYTIEISIQRNSFSTAFSKYYLDVPDGVTAKELNSINGSFAFEPTQKRAKIIWSETPAESLLKFSMMIEIDANAPEEAYFQQKYSFIEGEQKKEIVAEPVKIKILRDAKSTDNLIAQINTPPKKAEYPKQSPDVQKSKSDLSKNTDTPDVNTSKNELKNEFRIQILATAVKPTNLSKYEKLGKTSIYEEKGLYKLMVGSFSTKEDAKKKLNELKENGIDGFIVCFENGIKK